MTAKPVSVFSSLMSTLNSRWAEVSQSSLFLAFILMNLLLVVGTVGYALAEGWSPLDALYATVITMTTVGYGDLSPQSLVGRIFAIVFTLVAIGVAGYAISTLAAVVFEYERDRKVRIMQKNRLDAIAELKGHTIVCGSNVIAHRASNEFFRRDMPFIIIEQDEETLKWALLWMHEGYVQKRFRSMKQLELMDFSAEEEKSIEELAEELGILYLLDDPSDEQQLRRAGIDRAGGLIAALTDDRDNMAVILSARDMGNRLGNPDLRIVARVHNEMNIRRIYLAGADKVIAPNISGGFQLANAMLHPVTNEFWITCCGTTTRSRASWTLTPPRSLR